MDRGEDESHHITPLYFYRTQRLGIQGKVCIFETYLDISYLDVLRRISDRVTDADGATDGATDTDGVNQTGQTE